MKQHPSDNVPFTRIIRSLTLLALLAALSPQLSASPMGTVFTYQGRLNDGGNPASGNYDVKFTLYDALAVRCQAPTWRKLGEAAIRSRRAPSAALWCAGLEVGSWCPLLGWMWWTGVSICRGGTPIGPPPRE
jgi:hypothetical protein